MREVIKTYVDKEELLNNFYSKKLHQKWVYQTFIDELDEAEDADVIERYKVKRLEADVIEYLKFCVDEKVADYVRTAFEDFLK